MKIQTRLLAVFSVFMFTQCATMYVEDKREEFFQKDRSKELLWVVDGQTREIICPVVFVNEDRGEWIYEVRAGDHPLFLFLDANDVRASASIEDEMATFIASSDGTPNPTAKSLRLIVSDRVIPWGIQSEQDEFGNPSQAVLLLQGPLRDSTSNAASIIPHQQIMPVVYFQAQGLKQSLDLKNYSCYFPESFSLDGALLTAALIPAVAIDVGLAGGVYAGGDAIGITTKDVLITTGSITGFFVLVGGFLLWAWEGGH